MVLFAFGAALTHDFAYFPWMPQSFLPSWAPKKAVWSRNNIALNAALSAALLAWAIMHPSPGLQPMYVAGAAFFFRVNAKARLPWLCLPSF